MGTGARTSVSPWLVVLGLALGPAISSGIARFAYGLILPAMRADLDWSYAEAGAMNTVNALGYLAGALLAMRIIGPLGPARPYLAGLVITTGCLFATGLTQDYAWLVFWRILAGIGGAPVFICGGAMALALFRDSPSRAALAIALYFGGGGFGMLVSGLPLPIMLDTLGPGAWPQAWLVLGAICTVASLASALAVRAVPPSTANQPRPRTGGMPLGAMAGALTGYFLFGVGYIVHVTFLVAWMRASAAEAWLVALTWSVIAIGVMLSPFPWRPMLARSRSGLALGLSCAGTGLGALIPVLDTGFVALMLSAAVFGLSFFIPPTAVSAFGRANLPERQWGESVALFTVIFAMGQVVGPVAAGALADMTDSLRLGLLSGGVILMAAAGISFLQRPLPAPDRRL